MQTDDAEIERLYAYPSDDGLWVRTSFVSTIDGAASADDGRSGSLGGDMDSRVFGVLRSLADVVVVGAGTARTEGYRPAGFDEIQLARRKRLGLAPSLPIAVVSRRLDIPDALLVPGQIVVTAADASADDIARLRETVDVIAAGEGAIDWSAALAALSHRGLTRVMCEGGPSLHGELIALDLVDEVCVTIAPVMAAGGAPRISHGPTAVDRPMRVGHAFEADGVLLTRWVRDRA